MIAHYDFQLTEGTFSNVIPLTFLYHSSLLMTQLSLLLPQIHRHFTKCCVQNKHTSLRFFNITPGKMVSKQSDEEIAIMSRQLAPPLAHSKYKGQAGRVAVFGGCIEYTGAPYFAAISSLKVGADLVRVFCMKDAGPVIKSYSPELMVHPYLDNEKALELIEPWLDRSHVVLVGPGLGRDELILATVGKIIAKCKEKRKPLVVDADGLFYLSQHPEAIKDYPSPGIILTPNKREFANLLHLEADASAETAETKLREFFKQTGHATILCKGADDEINDGVKKVKVSGGGSGRRCGGQGDLLAGALTTFYGWALQHDLEADVPHDDRALIASYAACKLVRECNGRAFKKKGRSMLASDMIEEIHSVFEDYFEIKA